MDAIRSSGSANETAVYECREADRMVKIELEAAEALAGLANLSESRGSESITERVMDESNDGSSWFQTFPKCSTNSYEDATNFMLKKSEKSDILISESVKDEQSTERTLNPTYPTNCASSSGRKSRQNLTEAEMEARKIRRVLANRESARQTIRRRQAIYEELSRKAVDLAWENENLKREKENASKKYDSLKTMNECLKAQMVKIVKVEAEEIQEESNTTNEPTVSASSTNSPFIIYNQPPFLPFVWPSMIQPTNSVQLQCGPTAGLVFPSHIPLSAATKPDSSSCAEGSTMMTNGAGGPLYILPYPWLLSLPQNGNEHHPRSFNLNDKPKESSECQQFFPEMVKAETSCFKDTMPSNDVHGRNHNGFPPDGGGRQTAESNPKVAISVPVSCEALSEHDDTSSLLKEHLKATTVGDNEQIVREIHQVPVVCSGKRLGDMAAAAEARKRRKQLTRLKNQLHCRQLRMHQVVGKET